MNRRILKEGLKKGKVFKIGAGFYFAVQVPDISVGISGSRCSNCGNAVAYCNQRCQQCGLPLVGPFGFPQQTEWEVLTPNKKRKMVERVYATKENQGRLGYANVGFFPLTLCELRKIERLEGHEADLFRSIHLISPQGIKKAPFV